MRGRRALKARMVWRACAWMLCGERERRECWALKDGIEGVDGLEELRADAVWRAQTS